MSKDSDQREATLVGHEIAHDVCIIIYRSGMGWGVDGVFYRTHDEATLRVNNMVGMKMWDEAMIFKCRMPG